MILMGVVNLTPDSFREDTRAMTSEAVKALAITLLVEFDARGFVHVLRGIADGIRGKGGK